MASTVRVDRIEDAEVIREIVLSVWDSIAEDGLSADSWMPNFMRRAYLAAYVDETPVAILSAHTLNATALQVHIHVPQQHREVKDEIGRGFVDYIFQHTDFECLVAMIPVIFPNVEGFAKKLGFVNVGALKRAHRKDGELHDVSILQLEKEK